VTSFLWDVSKALLKLKQKFEALADKITLKSIIFSILSWLLFYTPLCTEF